MSLRLWLVAASFALGSFAVSGLDVAHAQSDPEADRFFADQDKDDPDDKSKKARRRRRRAKKETAYKGSLTSTTFGYRESGSISQPMAGGQVGAENASPVDRLFTDMRAQLDAKHISGGSWDARFDARVRLTPDERFQSGTFSGPEYDAREIYLKSNGKQTDFKLGRQFVTELAAVKIDGIRFNHKTSEKWSYIGFAGAYPTRGSRSVLEDYPSGPEGLMGEPGKMIIPVAAGLGGEYRYDNYYGSIGVVGIYPNADDEALGTLEKPRAFVTANGYLRKSNELDIYHFAVVDLDGAAGAGVTNLSLGINYKPNADVRLTASVHRVDTETLNVQAQTKLEDQGLQAGDMGLVQNNLAVSRISSQSARAGLSTALANRRFELSVMGAVRERPEILLQPNMAAAPIIIESFQSAEVTIRAVDRRSYKGIRFSGSFTSIFGIGETANINRSDVNVITLSGSRVVSDGQGELEIDARYVTSKDQDNARMALCDQLNPTTCFGTSFVTTMSVGGLLYYRFKPDWFGVFAVRVGTQALKTAEAGMEVAQPDILITSGFARIAYRF